MKRYYSDSGEPYKYQNGDKIKFWDEYDGVVRIATIRHEMSGFDGNGNGYNCIGENYDTDGDDIYEVGENNIYRKIDD